MKNKIYTFDEYFEESLKDKKFKALWEKEEPKYQLAKALIKRRLDRKMSQRQLAKKIGTSQALISKIETMEGNPSFKQLNKIASALDSKFTFGFK